MKLSRLPILLILLGSALLTLFFGWMLFQALHNDRVAFERDLEFQSQEQGITVSAARGGLEQRVEMLVSTLAASPAIRSRLARVAEADSEEELEPLRRRLSEDIKPYWQALEAGSALELKVFSMTGDELQPLLSMAPSNVPGAGQDDSGYLRQQSLTLQRPTVGIEYNGERATTVGVSPVLAPVADGAMPRVVGLLELEFGVVPNVDGLAQQLNSDVAILFRGADEDPGWWVNQSSQALLKGWLQQRRLPVMEGDHTLLEGGNGRHYLLTLLPLSQTGRESEAPVAAVAIWKDVTTQLEHRRDLIANTWMRWGVAWLIAESCLVLLLWGTRRATRDTMLRHQQRLESQKKTLESLNQRLEAQKETLETLNDIAALQESSFLDLVEKALEVAAKHLSMPFAIANRIEGNDCLLEAAYASDRRFVSGQQLITGETFCELTMAKDDILAIADADAEGFDDHPSRRCYALKSYIGTPIWVHGKRYGALAFSSDQARSRPFDEVDEEFVRLLARWIGATLMRWREAQSREELSQRLRKIASQTPGMIYQYRIDAEGRASFPYASDAIKTFYEMTPEQAAEDSLAAIDMILEEDRPRVLESIAKSKEELTPWHCEYRVQHSDGRITWLAGQSIPEREADGGTIWHGFLHDISERKRDERLKTEFISTVSHELRTPLTSISGALGLIQGGALGTPPETMRGMLATAHNNAQRLILLINDLLDMEKLVAGKMAFQMQEQPLMPLIDQAIESNQAYAAQFRAQLVITERLDDAGVNVDAMRLQQVMSNLLSNAAKFSPPDMQVEVRVESIADRVRISVIDSGPGIPEEFHERIFQKFSQADASSTRKQGGTGLGLAITRELVERMRGSINFFSEPGHGACFFVELPCFDLPQEAMDQVSTPEVDEVAEASFSGSRLLIVEDDPDTAALLATLVRHWGYRAEVAHTMNDAMKWLERRSFDAITLDLMLPDGNGLTLLRQLREQPQTRDIPVLVVSATAEEGQLEIGGRLEAVNWLVKPFDEQRLSSVLRSSLSLRPPRERILHIESDPELSHRVAGQVASSMTLDVARSLQEARYLLDSNEYGLISLDLTASRGPGWEVIPLLSQLVQQPAVVILSEEALAPTLLGRVKTAIAKPGLSAEALREAFERQLHGAGASPDENQEEAR